MEKLPLLLLPMQPLHATAPAAVGIGKYTTYLFVYKNITGGFLPTNPVLELFDFDPNRIFIYDERRMPQQ